VRQTHSNNLLDQCLAAVLGLINPKVFFDFITNRLDGVVFPIPYLQVGNLVLGLLILTWEWPLGFLGRSRIYHSYSVRFICLPLAAIVAVFLYQATNAALYYLIGCSVYVAAYRSGEVSNGPGVDKV